MSRKRFADVSFGWYDVVGVVVVAILAAVLAVATLADGGTPRLEETLATVVAIVVGAAIGQRWRRRRDQRRANAREQRALADDEGESRVDAMLPYVAMTIGGVFFVRAGLQTHGAWLWIQIVIGVGMVIVAGWSAAAWWRERDEDWW